MGLMQEHLPDEGVTSMTRDIHAKDLASFDAAFLSNSYDIVPVGRIDADSTHSGHPMIGRLVRAYDRIPSERM